MQEWREAAHDLVDVRHRARHQEVGIAQEEHERLRRLREDKLKQVQELQRQAEQLLASTDDRLTAATRACHTLWLAAAGHAGGGGAASAEQAVRCQQYAQQLKRHCEELQQHQATLAPRGARQLPLMCGAEFTRRFSKVMSSFNVTIGKGDIELARGDTNLFVGVSELIVEVEGGSLQLLHPAGNVLSHSRTSASFGHPFWQAWAAFSVTVTDASRFSITCMANGQLRDTADPTTLGGWEARSASPVVRVLHRMAEMARLRGKVFDAQVGSATCSLPQLEAAVRGAPSAFLGGAYAVPVDVPLASARRNKPSRVTLWLRPQHYNTVPLPVATAPGAPPVSSVRMAAASAAPSAPPQAGSGAASRIHAAAVGTASSSALAMDAGPSPGEIWISCAFMCPYYVSKARSLHAQSTCCCYGGICQTPPHTLLLCTSLGQLMCMQALPQLLHLCPQAVPGK